MGGVHGDGHQGGKGGEDNNAVQEGTSWSQGGWCSHAQEGQEEGQEGQEMRRDERIPNYQVYDVGIGLWNVGP